MSATVYRSSSANDRDSFSPSAMASSAAGVITSKIGNLYLFFKCSPAKAEAVLQAIIIALLRAISKIQHLLPVSDNNVPAAIAKAAHYLPNK